MNRWYYPALALLLGLFTAQVLATAQVYLSNAELHRTLLTIRDAGFLPIPNEQIMPRLQEWGPALFGGLFFTLSTGGGLSLLSLAAAWIWIRFFRRIKSFLILYVLLWAGYIVFVNYRGFSPIESLYFLIIPPLVFTATLIWIHPQDKRSLWLDRMIHAVPLLLLAILWTSQMDRHLFLNLRDKLLLSNPIGTKINDFYYDYTLYPAEVFKSLNQKILKTCDLKALQKKPVVGVLERTLLNYDYLNVSDVDMVDLEMEEVGDNLVFKNRGKTILSTKIKDFLSGPGTLLKEFSAKTDRHLFFRQFTFLSLLFGFPILLYVFFYTLLRILGGLVLPSRSSSAIASILCFLAGTGLLVVLNFGEGKALEVKNLGEALNSDHWQKRVEALKVIERKRMEIANFPGYQPLLKSPIIPERYWLVRALGVSRRSDTYEDLLTFQDDSHPNVVGMAFYALGQRGDPRAIKGIIKRIETSTHWYNQWHAYRALRTLGWKQRRSR